jgi:hypothetical protein
MSEPSSWKWAGTRQLGLNPRALGLNPRARTRNKCARRNGKRAQRKLSARPPKNSSA